MVLGELIWVREGFLEVVVFELRFEVILGINQAETGARGMCD